MPKADAEPSTRKSKQARMIETEKGIAGSRFRVTAYAQILVSIGTCTIYRQRSSGYVHPDLAIKR